MSRHARRGRSIAVTVALTVAAACGGGGAGIPTPRSFSPGPGTTVLGALTVPPDDRERVDLDLVPDLTIGGDGIDPETSFHGVRPLVDVDAGGNIYVTDPGNQRVQVYDAEGRYARTIGGPGNGPGELRPGSIAALSGETLAVKGLMEPALQLFDLDGVYRRTVEVPGSTVQIAGLASGFALLHLRYRDATPQNAVSFLPPDGDGGPLVSFPGQEMRTALTAIGPIPVPGLTQASSIAPAPDDTVYVASGIDYEVARVATDGTIQWILRVPWVPLPLTPEARDYVAEGLEDAGLALQPNGLEWPDVLPALGYVRSDGAGRLFVFPATFVTRQPEDDDPRPVPVDVYGADGSSLLHARVTTSRWAWQTARGPFVYGVRTHPETGEWQVVRYRLDPDGEHLAARRREP